MLGAVDTGIRLAGENSDGYVCIAGRFNRTGTDNSIVAI